MNQKPNLKPAILKFLEKKINKVLQDIGIDKNFLNSTSAAQGIDPKLGK